MVTDPKELNYNPIYTIKPIGVNIYKSEIPTSFCTIDIQNKEEFINWLKVTDFNCDKSIKLELIKDTDGIVELRLFTNYYGVDYSEEDDTFWED